MNISYDYYRVFYYAAKYENFTQAAKALMSNQPNVTRTIKKLENELGCRLFVRSGHRNRIQLTPEGRQLYGHVSVAFDHIAAAEEEICTEKSLDAGTITIAANEIAVRCSLLPVLKRFRSLYPGVRIRLIDRTTLQAISLLQNGLADFAVVTTLTGPIGSLHSAPIREIHEVAVCSPAFSFLSGAALTLRQLAHYPIISVIEGSSTYAFYSELFSNEGLTFAPEIETTTADHILPMVKSDLGIGFVPVDFLQNETERENILVLSLEEKIPPRTVCLLWHGDDLLSPVTKRLKQLILSGSAPEK